MIYLSQLLKKPIYYHNSLFGKIEDMAIVENRPSPPISNIVVKKGDGQKLTLPPTVFDFKNENFILKTQDVPFLPFDANDFYLSENILDKQVIDVDGRRVVRVNDVLLESNGELKVIGIDVGLSGVFRRLGLSGLIKLKPKTLPWSLIEAFDYHFGSIKLRLTQNRLNTFHPSELADILEEVGVKERLSIVDVLDAKKAAMAIEEADNQTQLSIFEDLSLNRLKNIVGKMRISELADIIYKINKPRTKEIQGFLGTEQAERIKHLSAFPDDAAGGLMILFFYKIDGNKTIKELFSELAEKNLKPEAILVTNGNDKLIGIAYTRHLINIDRLVFLKDMISDKKFVNPNAKFLKILRLFARYNLRILPVVNKDKQPIGVITIDNILQRIEEKQEEKNDIL